MTSRLITDPVINSPFEEPQRHYRFDEEGITNEIVESRRVSAYFVPIPQPKKKGKQLTFETEWTSDRLEENRFINQIRAQVSKWRKGNYAGVTRTTRRLLEYWQRADRSEGKILFFCQIEAMETVIYLAEVASKYGDAHFANELRSFAENANTDLFRIGLKLATGAGKTLIMSMLIAWQALNKAANPQDARFTDTFLVGCPNITIRDRLRVLQPNDIENYYRGKDIVPLDLMDNLGRAKILITNYHAFLLKEKGEGSKLTKVLSGQERSGINRESPEQMVRRVCRGFGSKKNIIVINDEAHHCYRSKPKEAGEEKLTRDEKKEIEQREEEARVWLSGLEAINRKTGIKAVYDLSATPFYLKGSGYPEGTLFPWVVSDFSLIDAIESGIVKVPRVPIDDDRMKGNLPTYRHLWNSEVRAALPKGTRKKGKDSVFGEPKLPALLQAALHSLYGHYETAFDLWEKNVEARERGLTPPVFIVVCNNTNVSKMFFDYISGWEKPVGDDQNILIDGALPLFNNVKDGRWIRRPYTILVDSQQLSSGEAMSTEFKKIAALEIEEFQQELIARGGNPEGITDEELLREVLNTVGKSGKLGEHVRCVVSVSMLAEGWDANTVTHVMGVRAFGTQLLCEQVVGRGLRRVSYAPTQKTLAVNGKSVDFIAFSTEYADIYGVPFSFIATKGATTGTPGPTPTHVRALEERINCKIEFPRLIGYRYVLPRQKLKANFKDDSKLSLSSEQVPLLTENAPIVGESVIHTLEDLQQKRPQEVAFLLAKLVLEKYFRTDTEDTPQKTEIHKFSSDVQAWLFPDILRITKQWLDRCVECKGSAFIQMLLLIELAHDGADRIYGAIVDATEGEKTLIPITQRYDVIGSTEGVEFDTTRSTYRTMEHKCHISHVVGDSNWEHKLAQVLENMDEVVHYVKNQALGFTIPYTLNGEERNYYPDFIAHVDDGVVIDGKPNYLNLIIEVSGESKKDKTQKVFYANNYWVPAVNNARRYGRWAFVEVKDPYNAEALIREVVRQTARAFAASVEDWERWDRERKAKEDRKRRELEERRHKIEYWRSLDGEAFERELAAVYNGLGYQIRRTPSSGDGGVDLILRKGDETTVVQCKARRDKIGISTARELSASIVDFKAHRGVIACFEGVTQPTVEYISDKPIEVIDLNDIIRLADEAFGDRGNAI
jgi:type III restriction enzyme